MSLPKLKGKITKEKIIEEYKKLGWKQVLEFPWVEISGRGGQIVKKIYRFDSLTMQCSSKRCSRHGLTFVKFVPHGVVWTCAICRRTMGPMAWEDGELLNGPVGQQITLTEAWDTIHATGQTPPIGLQPLAGSEGLVIV